MASAEEVYRKSQKRLHQTLGSYLLVKAWEMVVDCIAIKRQQLLNFLQLERMKNKRIDWLKDDLTNFFPYQMTTNSSASGTYATLYLSRFPLPPEGKKGSMTDEKRVKKFCALGLKSAITTVPKEDKIISSMALLSNGIITPKGFEM